MSSAPACNQHFNSRRSANGCRLMNFFRFHKVGLRRSSWHLIPTAIHHNQCEYIIKWQWFMKYYINRQSWLFFIFAITSVILSTKLHECVSATPLSSLAVWIHLFEVPRQSTAVLAEYCKPAGRCCRTWGRRRLSPSPGSPTYLKRAGTQTRQTSGRRSLHAPAPRLTNALRSVPVAVAEHHLTATCWNKKKLPVSAGRAELCCSVTSLHFSIVAQKYHFCTDISWWKCSIPQPSAALTLMEPNPSDNLKLKHWLPNSTKPTTAAIYLTFC